MGGQIFIFNKLLFRYLENMTRATLRQIAMGLLYKHGGLKGGEAGHVMGLDYSTVSQGRMLLTLRPPEAVKLSRIKI